MHLLAICFDSDSKITDSVLALNSDLILWLPAPTVRDVFGCLAVFTGLKIQFAGL